MQLNDRPVCVCVCVCLCDVSDKLLLKVKEVAGGVRWDWEIVAGGSVRGGGDDQWMKKGLCCY